MRELIYNLQPAICVLFGIVALFIFPQRIDKAKARTLFKNPRWYVRMIPGVILALTVSFFASFIFTPNSSFIVVNAALIFILIVLYEVKLFILARKAVKDN